MNRKALVTIAAIVLVGLGVNLERFGIDVSGLTGAVAQTERAAKAPPAGGSDARARSRSNATASTEPYPPGARWSDTDPRVNLRHIFEGETNRKGKPVGFHARPGGSDPEFARLARIQSGPNRRGVYTARVEIRDDDRWQEKFSSFFPDRMSRTQVVEAILNAYRKSGEPGRQPWTGPSGQGFDIQGYTTSRGDINTAFPVYRRD